MTSAMRVTGVAAFSIAAVLAGMPRDACAQLQHATIHGQVLGPDGRPVAAAIVTLLDGLGDALASVTAGDDGTFRLSNVSPGTYALRGEAPPLRAVVPAIVVGGALPIAVTIRMSAVASEQLEVRAAGPLEPGSTTTRVTIAGEAVRRTPARLRSRGLQDAIATAPGWATEDNGLLHVRGVDDGFLYVIDGVPVYERIDGLFGVSPDPSMIDAVTVSTGYIPPEFGFKSGGVIEVRSASRAGDTWAGAIDAGSGSDATHALSTVLGGPLGRSTALTFGIAGQRSARFLDPVHPDNFHNDGGTLSGGGQLGWSRSADSAVTIVGGFGRSVFDVPHGELQEAARQDQRQRLRQLWQTVSWQRIWSAASVSQVAAYYRSNRAALIGSAFDTPLHTNAERRLERFGILASVTHQAGRRHLIKVGGEAARLRLREQFRFAVTDLDAAEDAGLTAAARSHTPGAPFEFHDSARPVLMSVYAQDSFRPADRLTIDAGLRIDWSRMLARASQWSPRLGASYRPGSTTTLRASFGRFFQPPQPENLLLASSAQARRLSPFVEDDTGGGAELNPERQSAVEVGVEHIVGSTLRLDVAAWRRRVEQVADPNVFFGTTIVFPNTVAEGRASGVDVRLEWPRRAAWSAYVSYTNSHVEQTGPITGGLFLEADLAEIGPGVTFTPDHDQRHVGAAGLAFDHDARGLALSLSGRYESGTPIEVDDLDDLVDRPGADLVDVSRGRVRPRRVVDVALTKRLTRTPRVELNARVSMLNVFGARWAFNFGNPFSGTHFGPGRTVHAGVRLSLR